MKVLTVFWIAIFLFGSQVFAEEKSIDRLAEPILSAINGGNIENLFTLAFPIGSESRKYFTESNAKKLDEQFLSNFKALGNSYGYSDFHTSEISGVMAIKYYLFRFQNEPVLVKIRFYKADKTWEIKGLELDDNLEKYLEGAAKERIGYSYQ